MRFGPTAFVLTVLGIAVGGVVLALTAPVTTATSVAGTVPARLDAATTGDPTCGGLGLPFSSDVITVADGRLTDTPPPGIALTVDPGGRSVAWAAAFPLHTVVVGAGGRLHLYAYDPPLTRDAGLAAPRDGGGMPVPIDRLLVCWGADGVEVGWCPPAFWTAPVNGPAWRVAGIDPDDRFSTWFGAEPARSAIARELGAPSAPTLRQVLAAQQWYGGDAADLVADLLSDRHPDVPFTGARPAATCPL